MPCAKRMTVRRDDETGTGCHALCLHRRLVRGYQDERIRQEDAAREAASGYETEYREYLEDHPLITFKEWLVMHKTSDREETRAA